MNDPQPIDYRSPDARADRTGGSNFSLGAALSAAIFAGVLWIILVFVIPRLDATFKDFGAQLPFVTIFMLNVARWFQTAYYAWFALLCVPVLAGMFMPKSKSAQRWARLVMVLCFAGVVLLVALAVLLPMVSLLDSVGGGKR